MNASKQSLSNERLYYRHSLPVRVTHWIVAISLPILLMSGLNIFNADPELYWGKSSYTGAPPLLELKSKINDRGKLVGVTGILGNEFNTTGFLGVSITSGGEPGSRGFPSWLTLPGDQWLSMARRWHLFFAWILVVTGICFVSYTIFSRHLKRDLLPSRQDWHSMGKTLKDHLLLRHASGEDARNYNILQKLAYLSVIFLLLPLVIINGFGMSPGLDALIPGWIDLFGGRQSMRTLHFLVSWALVSFVGIHLFQVIITGFWNNLRSMFTGYYRTTSETEHE
ncbi:MAG: cytochrome b/b6 domain-containing protein [Desulfuromonadales bacterium]|nr:cytochrome b/b6 domain-containing protein [Desulfuromonadales bacterium]